ncbi:MAG TPA: energy transducer TonB [Holophagaceae bacterium]|nr:energy transducer TonB [Holophagaceae bacterium]
MLVTILLETGMAVGLLWSLRRPVQSPRSPQKATFNVELVEDPSPSAAGGKSGSGTTDPVKDPDPVLEPMADLMHMPDRSMETPHEAFSDPSLPLAPGGDGRPKGEDGTGDGIGIGPGFGIKGMGPGGLAVRIGDMEVLRREDPVYPSSEMSNGIEDMVELEVTIDEHGVPIHVKISKAKVPNLAEEALRAIKRWRFAAVRYKGVPVRATFRMDVDFMIGNKRATPKKL